MEGDARERLARRQTALVRALNRQAPAPPGVDQARLDATAEALARKRARAVRRRWPALAAALGPEFEQRFIAYVLATPTPPAGSLGDGLAFARSLGSPSRLPYAAREEVLLAVSGLSIRGGRPRRRRLYLRAALLGRPRRPIVVVRLPGHGVRVIRFGS